MLDLVHQEEQVAATTGMSIEQVLSALDAETPADLVGQYAAACDRYVALAGHGRKTHEQAVEFDRLDSSLRQLLGVPGLLAFTATLLQVMRPAVVGVRVFQQEHADPETLAALQLDLEVVADQCWSDLRQTPLPIEGPRLAELAHRAAQVSGALIESCPGFVRTRRMDARSAAQLFPLLVGRETAEPVWPAAKQLFDARTLSRGELHARVVGCLRLAGVAGCLELVRLASQALRQVAELVHADLIGRRNPC